MSEGGPQFNKPEQFGEPKSVEAQVQEIKKLRQARLVQLDDRIRMIDTALKQKGLSGDIEKGYKHQLNLLETERNNLNSSDVIAPQPKTQSSIEDLKNLSDSDIDDTLDNLFEESKVA